jgi:hypothetical protein
LAITLLLLLLLLQRWAITWGLAMMAVLAIHR